MHCSVFDNTSGDEFSDEAACHIAEKTVNSKNNQITIAICIRNYKIPIDQLRLLNRNQPQQTQSYKKRGAAVTAPHGAFRFGDLSSLGTG